MTYQLGIDLGTTYTAAAIHRDAKVEVVTLGNRAASIPSAIFLKEDESVLTGDAASRRAVTEPERSAKQFKRRVGDPTPILLGGTPYSAHALMAKLLRWVVDYVAEIEGGPPDRVAVTHPANWGPYKLDMLAQAIRLADLRDVTTLSEPAAAAISYASHERVETGSTVAVYDLGGGTFDAAVLRKTGDGWEVLGQPEGIEQLGGVDFDDSVFDHVRRALGGKLEQLDPDDPAVLGAIARLEQECIDAKEALSSDTDVAIPVVLPNVSQDVRLTRIEFEAMVRPTLTETVGALHRALESAGMGPEDIASVLLVGGSSRIPIVAQLVGAELGRPVAVDAHPKHAVALGAALAAARVAATAATPVEPSPVEIDGSTEPAGIVAAADVAATSASARGAEAPEGERRRPPPPVSRPRERRPFDWRRWRVPIGILAAVALLALGAGAFALVSGGARDGGEASTASTLFTGTGTGTGGGGPRAEVFGLVLGEPGRGGGRYVFDFTAVGFTPVSGRGPSGADEYEIHFFWNTVSPGEAVGRDRQDEAWILWTGGHPVSHEFFDVSNQPEGATAVCSVLTETLEDVADLDGDGSPDPEEASHCLGLDQVGGDAGPAPPEEPVAGPIPLALNATIEITDIELAANGRRVLFSFGEPPNFTLGEASPSRLWVTACWDTVDIDEFARQGRPLSASPDCNSGMDLADNPVDLPLFDVTGRSPNEGVCVVLTGIDGDIADTNGNGAPGPPAMDCAEVPR